MNYLKTSKLDTRAREVAIQAMEELVQKYGLADCIRALASVAARSERIDQPRRIAKRLLSAAIAVHAKIESEHAL